MSEADSWLQVRAGGMDLALAKADLREVVAMEAVSPLPGRPQGIQGVVIHQGEFLPVLAWGELPGCREDFTTPVALGVLRPRLALPISRLVGMVEPPAARESLDPDDPAGTWSSGLIEASGRRLHILDPDRLIALLRRFRGDR